MGATSRDRHSLTLIWLVYLAAIALGITAAYQLPSCRLPWQSMLQYSGICLFVPGMVLRWYSIIYLGRFFTVNVAIAPDHRVIDSGPYRYVRHPSYAGGLLALIGFSLTLVNWAAFLLVILPAFSVQFWRMHIEEAALLDALGEAYGSYMRRTKRLVPFLY